MQIQSIVKKPEALIEVFNLECKIMCQEQKRIVLLSNTKDLSRIIQLSLEEIAGWQIFIAELNSQNLDLAAAMEPDLILLDTALPDVEELATLRMILDQSSIQNVPIILLTERNLLSDRLCYESLGVASAIAKPFDIINLAEQIATQLHWNCEI